MSDDGNKRPELHSVENIGPPVSLKELNIHGVAAETVVGGGPAKIWTRLVITSDDPMFHDITRNLVATIEHAATVENKVVSLENASTVLIVMRPSNAAELWIDTAARGLNIMTKRAVAAGSPIFERDVGDVRGMFFPKVDIGQGDRVICLFREGWRFGLLFDFNPHGSLDSVAMQRDLGTLYRSLRFRNVYDAISNSAVFESLCSAGWFPFVEILHDEFGRLAKFCEGGFDLATVEQELVQRFSEERVQHMFSRWMGKPHFAGKRSILEAAIRAYGSNEPVAAIKIMLTEIEGVLRDAYHARYGKKPKLKKLLDFAVKSAEEKAGSSVTLLFPQAFGRYLATYAFANFDPAGTSGTAGSRHAVGHGAAKDDSYTQVRALQALLTLDQLAFYT